MWRLRSPVRLRWLSAECDDTRRSGVGAASVQEASFQLVLDMKEQERLRDQELLTAPV